MNIPGHQRSGPPAGRLPSFQITNWSNLGNPNTGNPFKFRDKQYVAAVNLQWTKQAHSLRCGFDYQDQQINHFQPQGGDFQTPRGTFTFNGTSTMLQNAPAPADARFNSWAAFLLGLPTHAGKVDQLRNPNSFHMMSHAAYAQDTWQVSRRLTLTSACGGRSIRSRRAADGSGVSRFDPADGYVYIGGVGDMPQDTGRQLGHGQFLPRAGRSPIRLNDKTVLRAGYGHSVGRPSRSSTSATRTRS